MARILVTGGSGFIGAGTSPIGTFRVNVGGSLNVFEAMRLFGVKRLVNLSSEETYGVFESDRIDETHPNRPLKPYGISKYAVERLACDLLVELRSRMSPRAHVLGLRAVRRRDRGRAQGRA
jgi:nucleoside-diphosphate-sugar epimerase